MRKDGAAAGPMKMVSFLLIAAFRAAGCTAYRLIRYIDILSELAV
jgi:hypothetical protein